MDNTDFITTIILVFLGYVGVMELDYRIWKMLIDRKRKR